MGRTKDPREGLHLRLGYETARDIEKTSVISLGVQNAAKKAINSVMFQRLHDQIGESNQQAIINEERLRTLISLTLLPKTM